MAKKISFSHSKLDVARTCFLQYKFKYVDKVQVEGKADATEFGGLIHEIAEHYTGTGRSELLELYHKFKNQYAITDFYRLKVPLALKNVHTSFVECDKDVKEKWSEDEVRVPYNDEIELNGKIDFRSLTNDDRHIIADYKTSKSSAYANHRNQLSMYMLMLHLKYGIAYEDMDMIVIYLALDGTDKKGLTIANEGWSNIKKDYKLDESDVSALEMEITAIWNKIQKCTDRNDWPAKPTKFSCTWCPFNELCDKKWIDPA
jgi:CRISPR/Cas system-associated exonuclease Cas4 (RecB family)